MPTIILSYRREDTAWIAGRVHDRLKDHYGADNVFMDIDSIPFGLDFREHIQDSLDRCDILVAIVGPRWATPDESGKVRLSEETDWVRIEIETALAKKIPVIPVLIDGTPLPPPAELPEGLRNLAFRQAAPVDSGRDFHPHMDRLIKAMDGLLKAPAKDEKKKERGADASANKTASRAGLKTEPTPKRDPRNKEDVRAREKRNRTALWQALVSTKGRVSRSAFWVLMITSYLAMYVLAVGMAILWFSLLVPQGDSSPAFIPAFLWLWVPFAVGGKRLHDFDKSAWWALIPMAIGALLAFVALSASPGIGSTWGFNLGTGIIGLCVLAALGFLKGTPGPNRYGPNPLESPKVSTAS